MEAKAKKRLQPGPLFLGWLLCKGNQNHRVPLNHHEQAKQPQGALGGVTRLPTVNPLRFSDDPGFLKKFGPAMGIVNIRGCLIIVTPKGTIILRSDHIRDPALARAEELPFNPVQTL